MTALPLNRPRAHDVRGQASPATTAPAAQGALPSNHGGGALCGRNPQL